ncbi:protein bicaudal C 1-like [Clarias magur]|uniref:Protein bicaudal C 1-like n=1 Tax=Clarias magur TaxID=1594786 RepID=A0A8J4UKF6_CLAMG|nr:protein bicaudal C 1-like [Clarias magur]
MAAQRVPLSGCSQHSDPGSNSERSADSPLPASESDSSGHVSPPNPDWTEERFRVDRKRLETLLLDLSPHLGSEVFLWTLIKLS